MRPADQFDISPDYQLAEVNARKAQPSVHSPRIFTALLALIVRDRNRR
jgi:hypothetical protein